MKNYNHSQKNAYVCKSTRSSIYQGIVDNLKEQGINVSIVKRKFNK